MATAAGPGWLLRDGAKLRPLAQGVAHPVHEDPDPRREQARLGVHDITFIDETKQTYRTLDGVFGSNFLWEVIMEHSYQRSVKNFAEEGTEMMAYLLMMFAMAEYVLERRGPAVSTSESPIDE